MAEKSAIAEETSIKKVLSGEYESPWGRVGSYKPLNDLKATPRCVRVRSEDKVRGKRMKDNTKGDDGKDEERAMLHGTIKPKKEKTRAERYIFLLKEYYGEGDIWRGHMKRKPTSVSPLGLIRFQSIAIDLYMYSVLNIVSDQRCEL